jgi:hypothetical protein
MDGTSSTYFYTKNVKYKNSKIFKLINHIKKIFKKDVKEYLDLMIYGIVIE